MKKRSGGGVFTEYIYPDYYKDFECIKGECRHNCCIGWEIDIDNETAQYYKNVDGPFGENLRNSISKSEDCHFILKEDDRCPFLNDDNLCEIIINLGKDRLCHICDCHPRFINEFPDRVETGLGLCCEAAASLILGKKTPSYLEGAPTQCDDEIITLRDNVITALQDRRKRISERISDSLDLCDARISEFDIKYWIDFLLSLERLDEKWTAVLCETKSGIDYADLKGFETYMKDREHEFEQLLVYFIYRHFANAPDFDEARVRAVFAVLSYNVIYSIGASAWTKCGKFDFEDMCETARLYSSEIEYSEDNLYAVFDEIYSRIL